MDHLKYFRHYRHLKHMNHSRHSGNLQIEWREWNECILFKMYINSVKTEDRKNRKMIVEDDGMD